MELGVAACIIAIAIAGTVAAAVIFLRRRRRTDNAPIDETHLPFSGESTENAASGNVDPVTTHHNPSLGGLEAECVVPETHRPVDEAIGVVRDASDVATAIHAAGAPGPVDAHTGRGSVGCDAPVASSPALLAPIVPDVRHETRIIDDFAKEGKTDTAAPPNKNGDATSGGTHDANAACFPPRIAADISVAAEPFEPPAFPKLDLQQLNEVKRGDAGESRSTSEVTCAPLFPTVGIVGGAELEGAGGAVRSGECPAEENQRAEPVSLKEPAVSQVNESHLDATGRPAESAVLCQELPAITSTVESGVVELVPDRQPEFAEAENPLAVSSDHWGRVTVAEIVNDVPVEHSVPTASNNEGTSEATPHEGQVCFIDNKDRSRHQQSQRTSSDEVRKPERMPRKYRPSNRAPSQGRTQKPKTSDESRIRALRIDVRLRFEKGGFCQVSFLPQRDPSLPEEITVVGDGKPPSLLALQEDWYQDVFCERFGELLRSGLVWEAEAALRNGTRWNLSGRDVYVLGRRTDLSGFVSIPRLLLGEEHTVLCTEGRLESVLNAIAETGSTAPQLLREEMGAPSGWVVLRGVCPKKPIQLEANGDTLDALRPLADVDIVIAGGIRLIRNVWLAGFPPNIRIRGDVDDIGDVLIDGKPAILKPDGTYQTDGWDQPGEHIVWCPSKSKAYLIQVGPDRWDPWKAYDWSLDDGPGSSARAAICGVVVLPNEGENVTGTCISIPSTNCVLVGATPGEFCVCRSRADLRSPTSVAFPPFRPVWALPPDPLRCDKGTMKVLLVGHRQKATNLSANAASKHPRLIAAWCKAILNAGRKGLSLAPQDADAMQLWIHYKRVARGIWRTLR